ncbi:TOPBP1 [Cordylochernes scorpioides]|uniref:TOPBP1 n=1 Tax=Cordylochernes scorpioides TaxID=51811 RepID=A0ABY6KIU7_9ARAC|nr:TOPBP1 [Cordylochernes scorpioides]
MDEAMEEVVEEEMNRCFEALKKHQAIDGVKSLFILSAAIHICIALSRSTILTSWKLIKMCKLLGNSPLKKLSLIRKAWIKLKDSVRWLGFNNDVGAGAAMMSLLTQDESHVSRYQVLFVEQAQISEPLKKAFEAMISSEIEPQWVPESALSPKKEDTLYVCDPFEGPGFSALEARKCRVVGPLCVLRCLQDRVALPHKSHPVFSVAMRGLIVTCTNISPRERNNVRSQIQLMGGHFVKDLVRTVTHLVVGSVGSTKYRVAATNGTPILTLSWVEDCWEKAQHHLLSATDPALMQKHLCPPFLGLWISVSQLPTEERRKVQSLVEANGGHYSGVLRAQETTHLVLREPQGEKYRFAQQWKLHCVLPEWVFDSIDKKFCQDESQYAIDGTTGQFTSTPKKAKSSSQLPNPECSNINGSFSHLSETLRSEVSIVPVGVMALSGSSIHLSGFEDQELLQLTKLVLACGGQVVKALAPGSVVVHSGGQPCNIPPTYTVVSKQWLLECHKQAQCLNTSDYLIKKCQNPEQENDSTLCPELEEHKRQTHQLNSTPRNPDAPPPQASPAPSPRSNQSSQKSSAIGTKSSEGENIALPCDPDPSETNVENEQKLFSGITFQIHSELSNEDRIHIAELVASAGGSVEDKSADILVVSPLTAATKVNGDQVQVTLVWLQECIQNNTVLSLKGNPLFQPIPVVNTRPLEGLPVHWGGEGCLGEDFNHAWGHNQEFLVRRANKARNLQANTHLVLPNPEGSKYQGACKWGLPTITKHWLLACARSGSKAPEEDYLAQHSPDHTDLSAGLQELLDEIHLCRGKENVNPNIKSSTSASIDNFDIPAALLSIPFDTEEQETSADVVPAILAVGNSEVSYSKPEPPLNATAADEDDDVTFVGVIKPQTPVTPFTKINHSRMELTPSSEIKKMMKSKISLNSTVATNCTLPGDIDDDVVFVQELNTTFEDSVKASNGEEQARMFRTPKPFSLNKFNQVQEKNDTSLNQDNTPSKFLNPDVKFLPKFDVKGILAEFESPDNQGKAKKYSLPLEEVFAQNIEKALNNFNSSQSVSKAKDKVASSVLLQGVVAYVGKKLGPLQNELHKQISDLGGEAKWSYDKTCTHYIYKGKSLDKEARQAKANGIKMVSPNWVQACSEEGKWVDESFYPPTFNPRLSLSQDIGTTARNLPPQTPNFYKLGKKGDAREYFSSTAPSLLSSFSKLNSLKLPAVPFKGRLSSSFDEEAKQDLEEPPNPQHPKDVPQHDASYNSAAISDFSMNVEIPASSKLETAFPKNNSSPLCPKPQEIKGGSGPSQNFPIGWVDYTGQVERFNVTDDEADDKSSKGPTQPKRKFMLSGFSDSEKSRYQEIITQLGGEMSECKDVDPTATHLVLAQPVKNEKFLASVSAGLWVVHTSYLDDSNKAKSFLPEEDYEWGGTRNTKLSASFPDKVVRLTFCPKRWRIKCQSSGEPAFHNWKVVIYNNAPVKALAFKRILQMGGASVLSPEDALQATHAFIDVEETIPPISDLFKEGVKCLKPEFLAVYLTDDCTPAEEEFLVPEALKLHQDSKGKKRRTTQAEPRTRYSKRTKRS